MMRLKAKNIIDKESEIHYAYHKSLQEITTLHNHNFFEIFLITRGEAVHKINRKIEILYEGTLVFIRPNDNHQYEISESKGCELINIAFPSGTLKQLFNYLGEGFQPGRLLSSSFPPTICLPEIEKDILISRFVGLNTIHRENKSMIRTELRILLAEIFSKYFSLITEEEKGNIPGWLVNVRNEMQKKDNFILGIKRMYELSGRSQEHFSRTFRKYYKETPTDYITSIRLNYAANLISNSDEEIINIAAESGFENLSHFYHLFKKHFGASPKDFRHKHRKLTIPF